MINAYADIYGHSGYATHSRHFFKALNKIMPVCLMPKDGRIPERLDDELIQMLQRLVEVDLNRVAINLDQTGFDLCRFTGKNKIVYTVFESTQIHPATLNVMKQMDQVWVPTQWGKATLANLGIPDSQIRVVPEGVDVSVYNPHALPFDEITARPGLKFLTVGKWETRKNFHTLLQAFDKAFDDQAQVTLVIHAFSKVKGLANLDVEQEIKKIPLKHPERILLIKADYTSNEEMARLYRSCDCYISASHAEGWGLPLLEAMACGLPVISCSYSGPSEFLNEENSLCFKEDGLEDVFCPVFFPNKGQHGKWATVNENDLIDRMHFVQAEPHKVEALGQKAAADAAQKWNWDLAAQKAAEILKSDF
ncbi:MAG: glycosyltransferase [Deltaproteobacteria bacterium]|nr:glycosyltransferase [Deltaproteobacteria bacterium]